MIDKDKIFILDVREKKEVINLISAKQPVDTDCFAGDIGSPIAVGFAYDNKINNVPINIKGIQVNFMDLILAKSSYIKNNHKDAITEFDDSYKFYYIKSSTDYVLVIKELEFLGHKKKSIKLKYSLSGILISKVEDEYKDNMLVRSRGNDQIYIKNHEVVMSKKHLKLNALSKTKLINKSWLANPNIGVIDLETCLMNNNIYAIYALGFMTNLSKDPVIYYIGKDYNSGSILLKMIDELLRPKYSNITFYTHNLGGYDAIFILKILYTYNDNNLEKYVISPVFRDDRIISLTIRKGNHVLKIKDSYPILSSKLSSLAKDFGVKTQKSLFPYKFSTQSNLFYVGNTPGIEYYKNIVEDNMDVSRSLLCKRKDKIERLEKDCLITQEEYKALFKTNWSFEEETKKYLINDLMCLQEVLNSANKELFKTYKVDLLEASTISGLAMKIYLTNYYNNNIPLVNKASLYHEIKLGYYGGITEVYKPQGENLYYYDVNSLYPFTALNDMPGLDCDKLTYFDYNVDISDLFGFFYCKIEAPSNGYLGLLPVRYKLGIIFPLGNWDGWYFSEELKFAQENGYKITVINGYNFNKVKGVFTDYVKDIYAIKAKPINKTQKTIAKSLLNNLLGRFGIDLDKSITKVISPQEFEQKSAINKIVSYKNISNNKMLVTYVPKLDYDIIKSHDLDFLKVSRKIKDSEVEYRANTSIVISAAITAYARIHINKVKLYIIKNGGKIYYSDTDSIVTNIQLPADMVSENEIGKMKLENRLSKGIFITNKTYCYTNTMNEFINKAKGVNKDALTYDDYAKLLNNVDITGSRTNSIINWPEGDVKITEKNNIKISSSSYTKRTKIVENGLWVNTRPLIISTSKVSQTNTSRHYTSKGVFNINKKKLITTKLKTKVEIRYEVVQKTINK